MFITRYVSVGSLTLVVSIFIEFVVWGQLNMIYSLDKNASVKERLFIYGILFIIMILMFIRHRDNLKRLANGTENKIGQKKEDK